MKKRLVRVMTILTTCVVLAGCGAKEQTTAVEPEAVETVESVGETEETTEETTTEEATTEEATTEVSENTISDNMAAYQVGIDTKMSDGASLYNPEIAEATEGLITNIYVYEDGVDIIRWAPEMNPELISDFSTEIAGKAGIPEDCTDDNEKYTSKNIEQDSAILNSMTKIQTSGDMPECLNGVELNGELPDYVRQYINGYLNYAKDHDIYYGVICYYLK